MTPQAYAIVPGGPLTLGTDENPTRFDPASFWAQFRHQTVKVDGVRLHYVEGAGAGPSCCCRAGRRAGTRGVWSCRRWQQRGGA